MIVLWLKGRSRSLNTTFLLTLLSVFVLTQANQASAQQLHGTPYTSPYSINYACPQSGSNSLTFDFNASPRNDYTLASNTPYAQWYQTSTYPVYGENDPSHLHGTSADWGPYAANYPWVTVPSGLPAGCNATTWKQERVLRVAQEYLGYTYQHHHIPDFNPYASQPTWPASNPAVLVNYPTAGVDCSDFSSWNYNFGLGIVLSTGVLAQGLTTTPIHYGAGGSPVTATAVVPAGAGLTYQQLCDALEPGDLLYINGSVGGVTEVTHVIMWLGAKGVDSNGQDAHLVIDSHDNSPPIVDSNGVTIPPGVRIRPFRQNSWYFTSFDHALRIIPTTTPSPAAASLLLQDGQ